jgi:ABC-type amino acid transport system permease subunit
MNSSNASDGVKPYISLPAGHVMGYADALRNHMQQFYTSLRQESYAEAGQPYTTLEESAYIGEIIESCIKSSRNGRWEQVGER